jgi:hypothetical protein
MFGNFIEHGSKLRRQHPISNKRASLTVAINSFLNPCFAVIFLKPLPSMPAVHAGPVIHPASFAGLGKTCN